MTEPLMPILRGKEKRFTLRSVKALQGVHPDLRKVCDRAIQISPIEFVITEGKRSIQQQRKYCSEGKSQTMKSRHLTGHAVDFVNSDDFSYNEKKMRAIADAFKKAARELNIPIRWGGDWKSLVDTPHVELYKGVYPG
jgi:peptidoglycan L-alanyl-D-glutamate endopeptidase CwlK